MLTDGETGFTTDTVIEFDVAGLLETPLKFEVITQETIEPFVNVEVVKVVLFDPVGLLFTYHWYEGFVPPFVGEAVKVTSVPAQIELSESEEVTETRAALGKIN